MTRSIWKSTATKSNFPVLSENLETEIAIVGGGITGITAAYLLARSGKKVVLLEAGALGGGTTGDSTGNLYAMVDKRLHHIQSKWDKETASKVAQSRAQAVNLVEELVNRYEIDCSFKRVPWYLFSETEKKDKTIEKEIEAAKDYGLPIEELHELPIPVKVSTAIKVENQAQFNPAAFVRGLAEQIDSANCRIFENSEVHHIEKKEELVLSTSSGTVTAKKIILATHTPKGIYGLQTALYPYREYAIAARLKSGDFPDGIYWDTEADFHTSMRTYSKGSDNYVLVLGGHHKVGQEDDYSRFFDKLDENARRYFDVEEIEYRWSAQHYKPADGLPYIGESTDDNIYLATGFSTDGLTYGVLAAMILDDQLNGRENAWRDLYKASRFTPVKSAKNFIKENINVAKQYLKDLPGKAEVDSLEEIGPGQGKVMEIEREKWAVYRDDKGELHCQSAVCTHMDCIVDWNDAERSWDCPCHGSRFKATGEVIEGPAFSPLDKRNLNKKE
ncbi:FAD-dependent oxidoreductase [Salinimicrobium sp. TH3]|uniref:FAD-dependent oxidoreductase n=1 Tax=Salinimicrobium sp. TH3 TaxID=2997342 RepID=UPI002272CEB6|nr:FAD-dependent oxidoreductase [Salinimicrobium sp. TH3]MCY2685665.1 FAD-dependent oxidoreductase [Salinimicrobium sp. TH3]